MVEVHLWSGLRKLVDGAESVTVQADTVGGVLRALAHDYPPLAPTIEIGVSLAVNGKIYANDMTVPVPEGAEVHLMQQLKGG